MVQTALISEQDDRQARKEIGWRFNWSSVAFEVSDTRPQLAWVSQGIVLLFAELYPDGGLTGIFRMINWLPEKICNQNL